MWIEKVVRLPPEDSGLQHSIVRLHNLNIDAQRQDRSRFFRREAVVVLNPKTGTKVLRYVMGTPGGISITKAAVALDYDAVDALGVRFKSDVRLKIRRARTAEVYAWFMSHPDLSVRLSTRLSVFGAVLGLVGLLTGLLPLIAG